MRAESAAGSVAPTARRADSLALGAAALTLVLWASAFVGIRAAGDDLSPAALALGRLVVGSVVLGTLVAVRRQPLPRPRDLPLIGLCGLLWFAAYNVALNAGERRVDAGTAAMLVNVGPVLIPVLAGLLLGEGFPRSLFAGCAIAFGGVVVIGLATSDASVSGGSGTLLCLLAALGYAGGVVTQKLVLRSVSALQTTFLCCLVAVLALSPAAPSLVRELDDAPGTSVGWVVYLGALPTAVAFTTWAYALARTSAGRLSSTTYLVPALSILLGWMLLGETPPALAFAGGAVALAGVAVARRRPQPSSVRSPHRKACRKYADRMIAAAPFGRTGHESTRAIFGAAALSNVSHAQARQTLELLLEHGVNHIDTASSYGDSELHIAPWLKEHPDTFFLATKMDSREYGGAREEFRRSLERLGVDRVDLLQLHSLADPIEWETALREGGALEAAVEAREEGLVDFIGITGHGLSIAAMHRRALERFPFDAVLLPYNFRQLQDERYATEFEALVEVCAERGVAVQTIKSIALAPRDGRPLTGATWYEPLTDPAEIELAVHWVLGREDVFLNTVGDIDLLPHVLAAADRFAGERPAGALMEELVRRRGLTPLFV